MASVAVQTTALFDLRPLALTAWPAGGSYCGRSIDLAVSARYRQSDLFHITSGLILVGHRDT